MVAWVIAGPFGPNICVASRPFKHNVRGILTSDLDKNQNLPSLDMYLRSCVKGMLVIITSVEHSWCKDIVVYHSGAKHSPPGHQGAPNCPEGVPPVCRPGPPLILDISGSRSSNEINSILVMIFFDALPDGMLEVFSS